MGKAARNRANRANTTGTGGTPWRLSLNEERFPTVARKDQAPSPRSRGGKLWLLTPAPWLTAFILAGGFVALRVAGWHPAKVPISAHFTHTGPVGVTFSRELGDVTSPACGCVDDRPDGGWQGITFPAANLEMELPGNRLTHYDAFVPDPATWADVPNHIGLRNEAAILFAPESRPPTGQQLIARKLPSGYLPGPGLSTISDWVSFESRAPLHISAAGPEPIAALGPPSNVEVALDYSSQQIRPSDETLVVTTPFGKRPKESGLANAVPLLDTVGNQIVLWTRITGRPTMEEAYNTVPPAPWQPNGPAEHMELSAEGYDPVFPDLKIPAHHSAWLVIWERRQSAFSLRLDAMPGRPINPEAGNDALTPIDGELGSTTAAKYASDKLVVRASHLPSTDKMLEAGFRWTATHPRLTLKSVSLIRDSSETNRRSAEEDKDVSHLYRQGEMNFNYPPTPPVTGVNLFGSISTLKLGFAEGQLVVGHQPEVPTTTGTPIELRNLSGTGLVGQHMTIPVKLNAAGADINVQGSALVTVNGESVGMEQEWWRQLLPTQDPISFVLALMSAIFGAVAASVSLRNRPR